MFLDNVAFRGEEELLKFIIVVGIEEAKLNLEHEISNEVIKQIFLISSCWTASAMILFFREKLNKVMEKKAVFCGRIGRLHDFDSLDNIFEIVGVEGNLMLFYCSFSAGEYFSELVSLTFWWIFEKKV